MRLRRALAAALLAAMLAGGCAAPSPGGSVPGPLPGQGSPPVDLATPEAAPGPAVQAAAAAVGAAVQAAGFPLSLVTSDVRFSEPAPLLTVRRAVYQAQLPDPNAGYIVIYDPGMPQAAATAAQVLAAYLGSGFGQTNYATDAQFSVAQLGSAVIFTWWSHDRSSDPAAAQKAFDAVASVGQPVPVTK